jgi:hypothetical protein
VRRLPVIAIIFALCCCGGEAEQSVEIVPAHLPARESVAVFAPTWSPWSATCVFMTAAGNTVIVPPPPESCAYVYSAWSACGPDGIQTRTVLSSSPSGCVGAPVLTQSCVYMPPPPCSYTYSAWSACWQDGTQTRSVLTSSPDGCSGTPVLIQTCVYTPPPNPGKGWGKGGKRK